MYAHKTKVNIPANHELTFKLPDSFPAGLAEVIILASSSTGGQFVKLAGVLATKESRVLNGDPIADSLQEFRQERKQRFEKFKTD